MTPRISAFWAAGGTPSPDAWAAKERREAIARAEQIDLDDWVRMPVAAHVAACEAMGFSPPATLVRMTSDKPSSQRKRAA